MPDYKNLYGMISQSYEEFYYVDLRYYNFSYKALRRAEQHYNQDRIETAEDLISQSHEYGFLSGEAFGGASKVK